MTVLARSESLDSLTLDGPRGRATLGLRPAALIRVLPGRRRSRPVPQGAGAARRLIGAGRPRRPPLQSGHGLRHPRPHRAQPDRAPPHRHRADRAVQLPVRPPHRRHVRPAPRGHRRRPQHRGVREGHPRRPPLAGDRLGRGPGRRRASRRPGPTRRTARCSASTGTPRPRRGCSPTTWPIPATARPRSSTPTARRRRRRSCRRATSAGAPSLTPEERAARDGRGPPRPPRGSACRAGVVGWDDLVRDRVEIDTDNLGGDFVIVRADGTPLYHFTVVVDDAAMAISHVIRGEDHVSNTPKHILLFEALGYPVPGVRPPAADPQRRRHQDEQAQEPDRGRGLHRPGLRSRGARQLLRVPRLVAGHRGGGVHPRRAGAAVRARQGPEGRRALRPRAPRVAQRPVDPAPRRRRPRRAPAAVPRGGRGRRARSTGRPSEDEVRRCCRSSASACRPSPRSSSCGLPVGRRPRRSTRRCSSPSAGTRRRRPTASRRRASGSRPTTP